jgi:hypothetical protein
MKRTRIPKLVDIVTSEDADEIKSLAQDTRLDRAYSDRSVKLNGLILQRLRQVLEFGGRPFPTVSPNNAPGRAEAQDALWKRLNAVAPALSKGPEELESVAAFVRGDGAADSCGPLAQQIVGRLFKAEFNATPASWNAALVLNEAPRTVNPVSLAWWAATGKVEQAKQLLAGMVDGDLSAMHAIGVAVHNIVSSLALMRQLYSNRNSQGTPSPEEAGKECLVAPATVIRQPTADGCPAAGGLGTGTLVLYSLQAANEKAPGTDVAFMRGTWSQCPAEQWVPAFLEGVWRRACQENP